jgi:hypothetical protein
MKSMDFFGLAKRAGKASGSGGVGNWPRHFAANGYWQGGVLIAAPPINGSLVEVSPVKVRDVSPHWMPLAFGEA